MFGAIHRLFVPLLLSLPALLFNTSFAASSAKTPLVVVAKAQTKSVIKQVPLTGTVTSPKISRLSSEVNGLVKSINVDIGDLVKKGDVLLQLDREIENLTLKAAQAATLQAREILDDAKRRFKSGKQLGKQVGISQEDLDQRRADVKIAEAALKKLLAEEQKQQALVNRYIIKAPFTGVISKKQTEIGEWIDTGKPVLTLIAMHNLRIDFQVPQELYNQIKINNPITITLDALAGKTLQGKIEALVPISDPGTRTFLVRAKLNTGNVKMSPGMSAQGLIRLDTGKDGVVVARDAIMRYADGRVTVWRVKSNGNKATVAEQRVKLGHSFNGKVAVTEGLKAGDTVVVQGNESLKQDQTVRIHQE